MHLKKGDIVTHPKAPQWGIGKVLDSVGEYVHVFFVKIEQEREFYRKDNQLKIIKNPKESSIKGLNRKRTRPGGKSLDERIKRDGQNARNAKEIAALKLKNFHIITEKPDITRGPSPAQLSFSKHSRREIASLQAIAADPFHAMVEVETDIRDKRGQHLTKKQLWYANENSVSNLPLQQGDKQINVLSWTHPGIQLALVQELGKEVDIGAHGYTLSKIKPLVRAKFSQVLPKISGLYEPGGSIRPQASKKPTSGLKAVKLGMTQKQVAAFISKMNGMMLVSGAPGSGKTTVGMQRIRFLFDQQEVRKEDLKNVPYSPELTRIFLANQNLIDYSKEMLEKDLDIPSRIVELVDEFVHKYLGEVWAYKHHAKPRRKKLFIYDKRGRHAFFGLCNATQLKDCWLSFETQISERLAQARTAIWLNPPNKKSIKNTVVTRLNIYDKNSIEAISKSLADAFIDYSRKTTSSTPATSQFRMDSVYSYVSKEYEDLRKAHKKEGGLEEFDLKFQQWLYWVYDPLDGIKSYFQDKFYEGGVRIKNGIAAKMSENEILDNIRADWKERIYGKEEEPWLAFLLRFALPTQTNPQERFREMPNPLAIAEYEGERWTHVMIDEAQDLCVTEAALLSSFVHPDGAFTVSADFHQVVSPVWGMENHEAFKIGSSLREKGAHQSYPFAKNMRQSRQIGIFLQSFYHSIFGEFAPFENNDTVEGAGPLLMLGRASEFPAKIKQRMAVMKRNPDINSVALLQINEDEKAMEQMRSALEKQGVELAPTWASSDESNRLITTSVERIKGLEYDACFVVGMDDIENSTLNYSKNRAYVALSRPALQLTILCEEMPRSLQKIEKDLINIIRI